MSRSSWIAKLNGEWSSPENWSPAVLPSGTAVFESSTSTEIEFGNGYASEVDTLEFSDQASGFNFSLGSGDQPALTLSGKGVLNNSNKPQTFTVASISSGFSNPQLKFINAASAGGDDVYFCVGPESKQGYGGGVICFHDNTTAGSASFKVWTGAGIPPHHSTVGGEVSFCDKASADTARFTIYGSLGTDGDTFGNVVFHDHATAAKASFDNIGGTVSGGDGGNTQFYGTSSAANGIFNNRGGNHYKANGGDVAFDAVASGGNGRFYDHAAPAKGAYGGVTSFNNNPPAMPRDQGASAGNGSYFNYGACNDEVGGGGHLAFSARYGSPTAAQSKIVNYGSSVGAKSSAGHTIFSINLPTEYYPSAGNATIWNHPGESADGAAGYTAFSIYGEGQATEDRVPTAAQATLFNLGAFQRGAPGGFTIFSGNCSAGSCTLVAYGGDKGGEGGRIVFYDQSQGGSARVKLHGNGELDLSRHETVLNIANLELSGGIIRLKPSVNTAPLVLSEPLMSNGKVEFILVEGTCGFISGAIYKLIEADFSHCDASQFSCAAIPGLDPVIEIEGGFLQVRFDGS